MPKLAVVTGSFPAYTERFFAREMTELARRGVDFTIFALRENPQQLNDPEFDALRSRVEFLPAVFSPEYCWRCFRACFTLFQQRHRERLKIAFTQLKFRQFLTGARGHLLTARLKKRGFTHLYAHFANAPSTIAWVAAHEAELPVAYSFHARDILVEAQMLNYKITQAKAVFVCHRGALEKIQRDVPGAHNVIQMHHGLVLENFPYQPPEPHAPPVLLALGRNVPKKGWNILVHALKALNLEYRAIFVGEGLEQYRSDKIVVREFATEAELIALQRKATLFVAPYVKAGDGDEDGIPNAVLEAMALGTPVVGTDTGGLPQVLDPATGWVARAGDAVALTGVIETALQNPAQREVKAKAARKQIEERFELRKNFQVFMDKFLSSVK